MKEIIAMHGWAGNGDQWANWKNLFQHANWEWQTAERGYKKENSYMPTWNIQSNQANQKKVAICHSLGLHIIDKKVLSSATHVVLINSFSRFIPSGKDKRYILMALKKMLNAINTPNEAVMLRKFHIKAYKPNNINMASTEPNLAYLSDSGRLRLKNDLKILINSDSLPIGLSSNAKVLIINSEKDHILGDQTKDRLSEDLISHLVSLPKIINLQEEGHSISKIMSIKKIKHWLES